MGHLAVTAPAGSRQRFTGLDYPQFPVLTNLWGWWDTTDPATITSASNNVSQWNDKSGNARNLTPGIAASPKTGTRSFRGLNVFDFNGTMGLGLTGSLGFGMTNYTFMFVGGQDNTNTVVGFVSIYNNVIHDYDNAGAFTFGPGNHPASKVVEIYSNGANVGLSGGTGATPAAIWGVRKAGTSINIYQNSSSVATGSITATGTANGGISICWRAREGGNLLTGFCGEVLVYSSNLSDADVATTNKYLAYKWGL